MKKLLLLLLLFVAPAFGQGAFYSLPSPLPGAVIRVCPVPPGSNPCASPVSIFSDQGLTQSVPNPSTVGITGNFGFWVSPGQYTIQISGPVTQVYTISLGGGGGGFTPGTAASGAQGVWSIQTGPCGSNPNCTQIFGDGQAKLDATSNSTTTITCPDCAFVAGDVGKTEWMMSQGSGVNQYSGGNLICPVSTIASVTNSTTIVVNIACTANATATGIFVWGHKDGTTLHNMTPGCSTIYLPANVNILWDQSFLTTVPSCASSGVTTATGIPQPSLYGQSSNTQLIMTPDFNFSSCAGTAGAGGGGVCLGSGLSQMWELGIWGTGGVSGNANCANANGKTILAMNPAGGAIYFVNLSGICPGAAGLTGVYMNSLDEQFKEGGVQNVGLFALTVGSKGVITESLDNHNLGAGAVQGIGENILSTGQLTELGTFFNGCTSVSGTLTSRNSHYVAGTAVTGTCQSAVTVNNGGVWLSDADFVNQDTISGSGASIGVTIASGGKHVSRNTTYSATNSTGTAIVNSGTFTDQGGNTVTGTPLVSLVPDTTNGEQVLFGSCTGTDTAAGTIQFTNLGLANSISTTTQTCTAAASTSGPSMSRAGTLLGFTCASSAQGVNASDGVCTVLKNNVASALTCTIGNAAPSSGGRFYCVDNSHTVAYAIGDIITVQVATQAATTLANQRVTLLAW